MTKLINRQTYGQRLEKETWGRDCRERKNTVTMLHHNNDYTYCIQ